LSGAKLTYLPFIIKALSIALGKFPGLNVSLEAGGAALLQHHSHNIGIAMATSNGLVVPNIKKVGLGHRPAQSKEGRFWCVTYDVTFCFIIIWPLLGQVDSGCEGCLACKPSVKQLHVDQTSVITMVCPV